MNNHPKHEFGSCYLVCTLSTLKSIFGTKGRPIFNNNQRFQRVQKEEKCLCHNLKVSSLQFNVKHMICGAPMLLDLRTSQEKNSMGASAFPRIQPPKK